MDDLQELKIGSKYRVMNLGLMTLKKIIKPTILLMDYQGIEYYAQLTDVY